MMKKLILSSVAAATLAGGMAVAFAAPAFAEGTTNLDNCSANTVPGVLGVNQGASTDFAQVCLASNPVLPSGGSVTAAGNPSTQSGYVIAQGGDHNPGALAGYIGFSSSEGVVGCASGDFQGSGDNSISAIPPTGAPNVSTSGPCAITKGAP